MSSKDQRSDSIKSDASDVNAVALDNSALNSSASNSSTSNSRAFTFIAHWLVLLACWTLVIKFIFPLAYDYAYAHPVGTHIMWDFWWVAHLILAWSLTHWNGATYRLAMVISVVEIIIIVVKFALFFDAPDWTIWRTNWFINKVFVLSCFVALLVLLLQNRKAG